MTFFDWLQRTKITTFVFILFGVMFFVGFIFGAIGIWTSDDRFGGLCALFLGTSLMGSFITAAIRDICGV